MNNDIPDDNIPEDDFSSGESSPGPFRTPEELAAQDLADQKRRVELSEYFSAEFGDSDPREAPYRADDYLKQLDELDRQIANPSNITVRDYLGNPWVKPLAEIPSEKLEDELDHLLEFMYLYRVAVDTLEDVTDEELYRFIVEELLDEEIDDMSATGMTTHFIYEEFHPNDEYDAKFWADEFLSTLLRRGVEETKFTIAEDELYSPQGKPIEQERMIQLLSNFRSRFLAITKVRLDVVGCTVDGDHAIVEVATDYTGIHSASKDVVKTVGRSKIWLRRSKYGGWSTTRAYIAGWDDVS